jgi:hypothetical protein
MFNAQLQKERFDLTKYVDPNWLVSAKVFREKYHSLMSYQVYGTVLCLWLTVFVASATSYFNPVKTVNDLLKSAHQL